MNLYGGLKPEDWTHWGQFTTIKSNAAELIEKTIRSSQVIYCSPLVDPYQPVEASRQLMPDVLRAVLHHPPKVFVLQTRSPLIERDISLLQELSTATVTRISFSVTTNRDEVRRRYEPHCETNDRRLDAVTRLRAAGLEVYATLAPILPCNPEQLVSLAIAASGRDIIADPFHTRDTKARGATTRLAALEIARRFGETEWFDPDFQAATVEKMRYCALNLGFKLTAGPRGFGILARDTS